MWTAAPAAGTVPALFTGSRVYSIRRKSRARLDFVRAANCLPQFAKSSLPSFFTPLRREKIADLVHKRLRARIGRGRILLVDRLELAQELLLARRQLDRRLDGDVAIEVTGHRAAHRPYALVAQPEHLARLRLGG